MHTCSNNGHTINRKVYMLATLVPVAYLLLCNGYAAISYAIIQLLLLMWTKSLALAIVNTTILLQQYYFATTITIHSTYVLLNTPTPVNGLALSGVQAATFLANTMFILYAIIQYLRGRYHDPLLTGIVTVLHQAGNLCNNTDEIVLFALLSSIPLYLVPRILMLSSTISYIPAATIVATNIVLVVSLPLLNRELIEKIVYTILLSLASVIQPHAPLAILAEFDPTETEIYTYIKAAIRTGKNVPAGCIVGCVREKTYSILGRKKVTEINIKPLARGAIYVIDLSKPRHILITGMTGYGKTTLASKIACNVASNVGKVIIIDPHGEYYEKMKLHGCVSNLRVLVIDALRNPINPLDHMGFNPVERIIEIIQLMRKLFRIGPLQAELLERALRESYEVKGILINDPSTWYNPPPTLNDLIRVLRIYARSDERAITLLTHVETMWSGLLYAGEVNIGEAIQKYDVIIFDLHTLPTMYQQAVYGEALLKRLYNYFRQSGESNETKYLILIDEAHLLSSPNDEQDMLAHYTAELRKYGAATMLVLQNPKMLSQTTISNISVKIIFRTQEPEVQNYVASLVSPSTDLIEPIKAVISTLPQGYAVVADDKIDVPFVISTFHKN